MAAGEFSEGLNHLPESGKSVLIRPPKFHPGENLQLLLKRLSPNGHITEELLQFRVARKLEGGFYGDAVFPEHKRFLMKTTYPSSPLKYFLRAANWGGEKFPSQVSELAAQLDHLSMDLVSDILPIYTDGEFVSPRSYGYVHLPNGYAQIVEQMEGRGPKYNTEDDEPELFWEKRRKLRQIGYALGLEQIASIDEDNPFGMPNIWYNEQEDVWIWLDPLPAMLLRPTLGVFRFKFHQKTLNQFYDPPIQPNIVPFNKIHTNLMMAEVETNKSKFDPKKLDEIRQKIILYENLRDEFERTYTPEHEYGKMVSKLFQHGVHASLKIPATFIGKVLNILRGFVDFDHQVRMVFSAMEKAHDRRLVTDDELDLSRQRIFGNHTFGKNAKLRVKAVQLAVFYFGLSRLVNVAEAQLYYKLGIESGFLEHVFKNYSVDDWGTLVAGSGVFFGARLTSSLLVRPPATLLFGKLLRRDYRTAAWVSAVPIIGDNLAFAAQLHTDTGGQDDLVAHYVIRDLIAKLTAWSPSGDWGSDWDARNWKKFGRKLENWVEKNKL